jgi:hypothetical protein
MPNFYSFDELQAKAHNLSLEYAKNGEMFNAALMQQACLYLAHEENQEAKFSITRAVLEWKKSIENAKDSLTVELEDLSAELFADETFDPSV